jgi:uncharacterized membrane protein YbhN (UPF0104 family)
MNNLSTVGGWKVGVLLEPTRRYTTLRDFGAFQTRNAIPPVRGSSAIQNGPSIPYVVPHAGYQQVVPHAAYQPKMRKDHHGNTEAGAQRQRAVKRNWLSNALRVGCSIGLFAFLLKSLSWETLLTALTQVHYSIVLVAFVVGAGGVALSAYQWRALLHIERIHYDLAHLIDLYLVGIAFSHFLPTSVGGDALKALYIGRATGNHAGSTSAIIMCRVTGFIAMLLIALPTLIIWHTHFTFDLAMGFILLALFIGTVIGVAVVLAMLWPVLFRGRWAHHAIFARIVQVGNALSAGVIRPRAIGPAVAYGAVFWIVAILNCYCYALALHIIVPLYFYGVVVPLVALISFLPLSINGLGLRESAFVYALSTVHVPAATALLLAFLLDMQALCLGLIGGSIYLTMERKKGSKLL